MTPLPRLLALVLMASGLCARAEEPAWAADLRIEEEEWEVVPSSVGGGLSALPLLPGVSPLLSPVPLSYVRGLQPASTRFLVDGLELPWAFHVFAGPPVVPDAAVGAITLRRGAPDLSRGRALGGTVSLEPAEARRDGLSGEVSLDLLRAGALSRWRGERTDVSVGGSFLWSPGVAGLALGDALDARLGDYYARAEHGVGATTVRLLAVGAVDGFRNVGDPNVLGASLAFHRLDLRLRTALGEGTAEVSATAGQDEAGAELGGAVASQRARVRERLGGLRAGWSSLMRPWGQVRAGFDLEHRAATLTQTWEARAPELEPPAGESPGDADPPLRAGVRHPIASAVLGGLYGELRFRPTRMMQVNAGVRGDLWQLAGTSGRFTVSPHLSFDHGLPFRTMAYGGVALVHQSPTFLVRLPGAELAALRFGLQEAVRSEAGLRFRGRRGWSAQAELYVDVLTRTLELGPLDRDFLQTVRGEAEDVVSAHAGRGWGAGAELLVRRESRYGYFGWGSVSLQHAERHVRYVVRDEFGTPLEERSDTLTAPWSRAATATLFVGRRVSRWTFSGAARLQSGALEAGGLGSVTQREGRDPLRPGPRWIEADRPDWERLPPHFRLDARVAYDFRLGDIDLQASFDLQNLTFSREVTGYAYREEAASLEAEARGERTLTRSASSRVPGVPVPMLGLRARL